MVLADSGGGGGGGLDTEIKGSPASIQHAATWLGTSAADAIDDGADAVRRARSEALSDWGGDAGPAFATKMSGARTKVVALHGAAKSMGTALSTYADTLRSCQHQMTEIRSKASGAGLTVNGFVVQDPGPGPARPPDRAGEEMPVAEAQAYERSVKAYNDHQKLVTSYNTAVTLAGEVQAKIEKGQDQLAKEYTGMKPSEVATQATDWVSNIALTKMSVYHATALRKTATRAADDYAAWAKKMSETDYRVYERLDPKFGLTPKGVFASDAARLDELRSAQYSSSSAADAAEARGKFAGLGKNISRGLVGVGIVVDMMDGESVPQAVASNVGGYAAGAVTSTVVTAGVTAGGTALATTLGAAATGAAVGSVVPVVGTAVGAAVGLTVGIFASGAIDSIFKNGPDVGEAWDAGTKAVTDTAGAAVDAVKSAGDFVGGLFD